jgi:hypothetical protein
MPDEADPKDNIDHVLKHLKDDSLPGHVAAEAARSSGRRD